MKSVIRKDEAAVSPVIATILMVAITVVLAAVLYVMVSGLITPVGGNKPLIQFGAVSQDGNATFVVAGAQPAAAAGSYKVNLRAGANTGTAIAMGASTVAVSLTVGTTVYRITWTDTGGGGNLNEGDQFRVTGNNVPLTAATTFEFFLVWATDGAVVKNAIWTTP
jgi:archaeal type IV pilus assembly protein PilA